MKWEKAHEILGLDIQKFFMNETDLKKLETAVAYLLRRESFATTVKRLKRALAESKEAFVCSTVALDAIPCELPAGINSCWIFQLRKDVSSGCHFHPNSIQHIEYGNLA